MKPPNPVLAGQWEDGTEVTLRDLFAAFALAGLGEAVWSEESAKVARYCYQQADAMLAERARGEVVRG